MHIIGDFFIAIMASVLIWKGSGKWEFCLSAFFIISLFYLK